MGKDWLKPAGATQFYPLDTLSLRSQEETMYIDNKNPKKKRPERRPCGPRPLTTSGTSTPGNDAHLACQEADDPPQTASDEPAPEASAEREIDPGEPIPRRSERLRVRRGGMGENTNPFWVAETALAEVEAAGPLDVDEVQTLERPEELWARVRLDSEAETLRDVMHADEIKQETRTNVPILAEVLARARRNMERSRGLSDIAFTDAEPAPRPKTQVHVPPIPDSDQTSNPFKPKRLAEILRKVRIGNEITAEQRSAVEDLIREFGNILALNLSEVLPVSFAEMKFDIPEGTLFPKRPGRKKLSEPQRQALYSMLDELEVAKVIAHVSQDQVKAISPINMVPKPGGAERPSLKTLQKMANSECRKYGLPVTYPELGFHNETEPRPGPQPAKWRLMQNFAALNKATQIRPFPMGDLAAKQRAVAGHKFISVMDLQAGFHAIPIAPESVPYVGFYVEGRGYYVYLRMPFGLTGAPTVFCEMVAEAFHELFGKILEVWMDDMATAADDFDTGLENLRISFECCRIHRISLSATKLVFFMTEASFAGARVSAEGIRPDLTKVKSILEWPEPDNVLDLMGFLGLAGAYRSKICDFAQIAQPLSNLTRGVRPPANAQKNSHEYKKALKNAKIEFTEEQKQAFVKLKVALTSDPVLQAPIYNGQPFIVTTDGSMYGFGAVLSQKWEVTDSKGVTRQVTYPIAFASKRTSRTEERYIPFILEFAALKFRLDEFDSIIFGRELELETDCKALADLLGNQKLNSTHERWRESIVVRNILAVRHKPGTENRVCDALSRMYEGHADREAGPGWDEEVDPGWEARKGLLNDMYLLLSDKASANLLKQFEQDEYFSDILTHLLFESPTDPNDEDRDAERERKRRAHKAAPYMIEDGKLWLTGGKHSRRTSKVECIPFNEGRELSLEVHRAGRHFGRDMTVLALQQEYHWPKLCLHATEAVTTCPRCKNFGPRLLLAHLRLITHARPFDLLVGDYVSLPEGHGGMKTVLILVDVYSRYLFAFPSRNPSTGKFTVDALSKVLDLIVAPCSFMADGGRHFDCTEVAQWCKSRGVQLLKTPLYTPWTNGLAEGHIKLLIGRLKALCAPNVGEAPNDADDAASTPSSWPKHLTKAVSQLNDQVLTSLGYSPRELMTSLLSAERKAELGRYVTNQLMAEVEANLALTYALRQDVFANALNHANRRKKSFDKRVQSVVYAPGDLVQKYDARLDETHSTVRKLAPWWSGPLRVVERAANSYRLKDLEGNTFASAAHSRLLCPFVPCPGTTLADYAQGLARARHLDKTAERPDVQPDPAVLPKSPRPEHRLPLEGEDPTQPDKYQTSDDEDGEIS